MNRKSARAVLLANDRGGYTVPTDRLYPFQWNWGALTHDVVFCGGLTTRSRHSPRETDSSNPDALLLKLRSYSAALRHLILRIPRIRSISR